VVNAAEASVKGVRRAGIWTVLEAGFVGAVLGRRSASGRVTRVANEGAFGAIWIAGRAGGGGGIGSVFVRTMEMDKGR
jgi:hypothetical protein